MKRKFIWTTIALLLLSSPVFAQTTSAGVYGGFTTPTPSTFTGMVMADFGTVIDAEPWIQTYGKEVQVGADLILSPTFLKGLGATVGAYSNPGTTRIGVTYTKGSGQVRLLYTSTGLWQGIAWYNFNLTPKTYLQLWAAPAQGGSSWLVGIGHVFKE